LQNTVVVLLKIFIYKEFEISSLFVEEIALFANYVGALTVTKFGAQPSLPGSK